MWTDRKSPKQMLLRELLQIEQKALEAVFVIDNQIIRIL